MGARFTKLIAEKLINSADRPSQSGSAKATKFGLNQPIPASTLEPIIRRFQDGDCTKLAKFVRNRLYAINC